MPAASTATTTHPGRAVGTGRSSMRRSCGRCKTAAFIIAPDDTSARSHASSTLVVEQIEARLPPRQVWNHAFDGVARGGAFRDVPQRDHRRVGRNLLLDALDGLGAPL